MEHRVGKWWEVMFWARGLCGGKRKERGGRREVVRTGVKEERLKERQIDLLDEKS